MEHFALVNQLFRGIAASLSPDQEILPVGPGCSATAIEATALSEFLKRGMDLVISFLMLIASLPLLLVCALLIKVDSPGPVLFRQMRVGRNFRPFPLIKLRTMVAGATGPAYTLTGDPRVTRIGQWLRRFKLDEFPQFWNVLCGDMSLVGPRPVLPEVVREFPQDYAQLLRVRPGLTDPASLKYHQEDEILSRSTDPHCEFLSVVTPDKLRIARSYLRNATLWSDCRVLAATAVTLLGTIARKSPLAIPAPVASSHTPSRAMTHPLSFESAQDANIAVETLVCR
jgi:lipopolysaccharide/colanic/teichoic acid biosynthesis glycosyltransferase